MQIGKCVLVFKFVGYYQIRTKVSVLVKQVSQTWKGREIKVNQKGVQLTKNSINMDIYILSSFAWCWDWIVGSQ